MTLAKRRDVNASFRVVTWNCRRASQDSALWDYLVELAPDVALLQEVGAIPERVRIRWDRLEGYPTGSAGLPQRFRTVLMVRGRVGPPVALPALQPWVEAELGRYAGNLVAGWLVPDRGPRLRAVSVYSPAFPVERNRLDGMDVSGVRLTQNRDVWIADLLWASLHHQQLGPDDPWIMAGDFNLSETFDLWAGGPRGNREYLDRMAALGLVECLRQSQGALTPTFRNPRDGAIVHQIDHLFVTEALAKQLTACNTGDPSRVFEAGLSDHLPVIADFDLSSAGAGERTTKQSMTLLGVPFTGE